jgi:hypothetical protein
LDQIVFGEIGVDSADRGSHYFLTLKAGGKVDRPRLIQRFGGSPGIGASFPSLSGAFSAGCGSLGGIGRRFPRAEIPDIGDAFAGDGGDFTE